MGENIMSSTSRGYDRHVSDYYVTPKHHVNLFLDAFAKEIGYDFKDKYILDPACGGDDINDPTYTKLLLERGSRVTAIDIREDAKSTIVGNFLELEDIGRKHFDMVITNPPFALAMEFIQKGLEYVEDGGYVIMLLRLNFYGSKKRKPFFDEHMPKYTFMHHKRMSFLPQDVIMTDKNGKEVIHKKGSTDSIEYAHFVWQRGYTENNSKFFVI
jgi:hypothetical protein